MNLSSLKNFYFGKFSTLLIVSGIGLIILPFYPVIRDEVWFYWKNINNTTFVLDNNASTDSVFAQYLKPGPVGIKPVNTKFSIVIEKLGTNAPIVMDVPITDEQGYKDALKGGVAHASTSQYPSSEPGNVYLFAHSSIDFWDLGKYATVFNLLRKLSLGDKIYIFYDDKQFKYEVVNKETLPGWNTYPLTRAVIEPTLTLQTCDPPGTTLNRLVVTANLKEVIDLSTGK